MNPETIQQIKDLMAPVAEKIGQGAEFGWQVVMKQQMVIAVTSLIWVVLGVIFLVVIVKWMKKELKKEKYNHDEEWMFGTLGVAMSLSAIIFGLIESISHFINPAYYAIQFFIGLVK